MITGKNSKLKWNDNFLDYLNVSYNEYSYNDIVKIIKKKFNYSEKNQGIYISPEDYKKIVNLHCFWPNSNKIRKYRISVIMNNIIKNFQISDNKPLLYNYSSELEYNDIDTDTVVKIIKNL